MVKRIIILFILLISFVQIVNAQELTQRYTFVDGTTLNYPSEFLPFDRQYDRVTFSNFQTEIFVVVILERVRQANELDTLPKVLDWWVDPSIGYDIGEEEGIMIGEREAIRFDAPVDDVTAYERSFFVVPVDNGAAAIFRILPEVQQEIYQIQDEEQVLSIIGSTRFVDLRAGTENVLGNTFVFEDNMLIEYRSAWRLDSSRKELSSDRATLHLTAYTPEELAANQWKADPVEVLYYGVYAPFDTSIPFDSALIELRPVRGINGVRYSFVDNLDGGAVQHTYFVANSANGTVIALDFISPEGTTVLDKRDIQDMIQTIRPVGELPPFALMPMENPYDLSSVTLRYPDYWFLNDREANQIRLSSEDTNITIRPIAADMVDRLDLGGSLLDEAIFTPLDANVELAEDDVQMLVLDNGFEAATIRYTERGERGNTFQRFVLLVGLEDESALLISIAPNAGLSSLTGGAEAEALAIINTITAR